MDHILFNFEAKDYLALFKPMDGIIIIEGISATFMR